MFTRELVLGILGYTTVNRDVWGSLVVVPRRDTMKTLSHPQRGRKSHQEQRWLAMNGYERAGKAGGGGWAGGQSVGAQSCCAPWQRLYDIYCQFLTELSLRPRCNYLYIGRIRIYAVMKQASFVFVLVIFNYLFDFIDYLINLADLILQDFRGAYDFGGVGVGRQAALHAGGQFVQGLAGQRVARRRGVEGGIAGEVGQSRFHDSTFFGQVEAQFGQLELLKRI